MEKEKKMNKKAFLFDQNSLHLCISISLRKNNTDLWASIIIGIKTEKRIGTTGTTAFQVYYIVKY